MKPEQELQAAAVHYARSNKECVQLNLEVERTQGVIADLECKLRKANEAQDEARVALLRAARAFESGLCAV